MSLCRTGPFLLKKNTQKKMQIIFSNSSELRKKYTRIFSAIVVLQMRFYFSPLYCDESVFKKFSTFVWSQLFFFCCCTIFTVLWSFFSNEILRFFSNSNCSIFTLWFYERESEIFSFSLYGCTSIIFFILLLYYDKQDLK